MVVNIRVNPPWCCSLQTSHRRGFDTHEVCFYIIAHLNEMSLRLYTLKVITDLDYDKIKENENEWFGVLFDVVSLLEQSKTDLDIWHGCLRKEKNMNAD